VSHAAFWPIAIPLGGAIAVLGAGPRTRVAVALACAIGTLAAAVNAAAAVWQLGTVPYPLGGWGAPLGIDLVADGLSATMLLMAGVVGGGVTVYAAGYFAGEGQRAAARSFWPLWLFLWAALNAVFLSGDVFNLYVALELLTLAGVGLVVLSPGGAALTAASRYLLAGFLASMAYLLGVAVLYGAFGSLDIRTLATQVTPGAPATAALALITAALLLKTAVFPLHFWLPRAHASAITPASAILSALVIKASFYIALRLWGTVFAGVVTHAAAQFVGVLGAAAILWGGLQASRQRHLKLLIGYSTVSQVGYLFVLFPLIFPAADTVPWRDAAIAGGVYHALSHAFAKAVMFLAAGLMIQAAGSAHVAGMHGTATRLPMTIFAFGMAGLSVIGLPPSGGFVGKWLLLGAAVEAGQWWWALVIVAGGLLSAGYVFVVLGHALTPAPAGETRETPPRRMLEHVCLWLALAGFALGLRGTEIVQVLFEGRG
jgi:multicomponent Na+:H+ antiporter subunit D